MPDLDDVRLIASRLPGALEGSGPQFAMEVLVRGKPRGFVWSWLERRTPKGPRLPNLEVLAVRVPSLDIKEALLEADPDALFTEPHYEGYPAVLVRLDRIALPDLEDLIIEAWRCTAPASLLKGAKPPR